LWVIALLAGLAAVLLGAVGLAFTAVFIGGTRREDDADQTIEAMADRLDKLVHPHDGDGDGE